MERSHWGRRFASFLAVFLVTTTILIDCARAYTFDQLIETIFPGSTTMGISHNPEPLDMCFKNKPCWHIPKVYLTFKPNWSGGTQDVIIVDTALSWSKEVLSPIALADPSKPPDDHVFITISPGAPDGVEYSLRLLIPKFEEIKSSVAGFKQYQWKEVDGTRLNDNAIFVPAPQTATPVYFDCARAGTGKLLNCTAHTYFAYRVGINYIFASGNLPRWPEIDSKVRLLLNSLVAISPQ